MRVIKHSRLLLALASKAGDNILAEAHSNDHIVSYDSEPLILVNSQDECIGHLDKAACHDGEGLLHRAFSLFLFNTNGEVLLQQRVANKRLWPMFWSNSCCSHPRQNESMREAVSRRVWEELGVQVDMVYLYKFQYHATFEDCGSENELCYVYIGRTETPPNINTLEINAWKWVSVESLDKLLIDDPDAFTPWLKMEWQELNSVHTRAIDQLLQTGTA